MFGAAGDDTDGEARPDRDGHSPEESLLHLSRRLVETDGLAPTLHEVVTHALGVVPCDWAAAAVMDRVSSRRPRLAASTDHTLTDQIARIAVEAGSSPGIQSFETGVMVHVPDLQAELRFGCYPALMVERTPVRSVLSFRLSMRAETLGVLTLYAATAGAFDEPAIDRAELLADHAAIAVDASVTLDRAHHLEHALTNSRTIGLALGMLVERYKITPAEAFQQLRTASQHTNRKLADIAAELVETGEFTPGES